MYIARVYQISIYCIWIISIGGGFVPWAIFTNVVETDQVNAINKNCPSCTVDYRWYFLLGCNIKGFLFSRIFGFLGNGQFSKSFSKIFRESLESREPENPWDSRDSESFLEIFPSLTALPFFLIFSILDLNFSILLCFLDKLNLSFSIFSTN